MSPEGEFTVDFTMPARIDLVSLLQRAVGRPAFYELNAAFDRVEIRLKQDPRGIGDPPVPPPRDENDDHERDRTAALHLLRRPRCRSGRRDPKRAIDSLTGQSLSS